MELIKIQSISKIYKPAGKENANEVGVTALDRIDLSIKQGEYVAIVGPSGSGKSTLMQILGLLDRPTSGKYEFLGQDVLSLSDDELAYVRSRYIGFVFQFFNLLARTSAVENVELPLIYAHTSNRRKKASELLENVGLGERLYHAPHQLSGGQQQRVAIARALGNNPPIIFADEPTGNINQETAREIMSRLSTLHKQGVTVVLVTHDPEVAKNAERVIRIVDGKIFSDEASGVAPATGALEMESIAGRTRKLIDVSLLGENFKMGVKALLLHKLRSALSTLGIMIGVAAVIAMVAIGQGAQKSMEDRLKSMGSNLLYVRPGSPKTGHVSGGAGVAASLTKDDVEAIRGMITAGAPIESVSSEISGSVQVVYKSKNWRTRLQGVNYNYAQLHDAVPTIGRFFNEEEDQSRSRVCVLGTTVYNNLFESGENPLGAFIKINRINFTVIGIAPPKGAMGFGDRDDVIIVPLNTAIYRVIGKDRLSSIEVQVTQPDLLDSSMDLLTSLLRKRHKLSEKADDDFSIRNMAEIKDTLSQTTRTMTMLLGSIAAISLLVGGIGIMNIMLVSVTERTREIGLRKALGARSLDILFQFLIEAAIIGLLGGSLGILLGLGVALSLAVFLQWQSVFAVYPIALAFLFSFVVGVVFGFWPAKKASELSPIEALRYE